MADYVIRTTSSIQQIPPAIWEQLGGELPFQSQQWYAFGERVMADCLPLYILLYDANVPLARAVCWVVRYGPLPLPRIARDLMAAFLKRRLEFLHEETNHVVVTGADFGLRWLMRMMSA